jgi:ABC-type nitrate/sulfonate/bicarbonate transport system substrate-binding protein
VNLFQGSTKHPHRRLVSLVALGLLAGSTVAACGDGSGGGGADSDVVQVGVFPISTYLPDQVAQHEGLFEKNGLEVKLVGPAMTGATAYQLMTTNKLQSYFNDLETTTTAISSGTKIVVGGCVAPRSIYLLVANDSAGLPADGSFEDKVRALEGKRIGVTALGAGTDVAVTVALKTSGLAADDVTRIAVGAPSSAMSQLKAGRIDAYVTGSDSGALQITSAADDTSIYLSMGDESTPEPARIFASGGWAVSSEWAESKPDELDAYRKSLLEAIDWITNNPDEAAQIMSDTMFDGADLEVAQESVTAYIKDFAQTDLTCDKKAVDATFDVFNDLDLGSSDDLSYESLTAPAARS